MNRDEHTRRGKANQPHSTVRFIGTILALLLLSSLSGCLESTPSIRSIAIYDKDDCQAIHECQWIEGDPPIVQLNLARGSDNVAFIFVLVDASIEIQNFEHARFFSEAERATLNGYASHQAADAAISASTNLCKNCHVSLHNISIAEGQGGVKIYTESGPAIASNLNLSFQRSLGYNPIGLLIGTDGSVRVSNLTVQTNQPNTTGFQVVQHDLHEMHPSSTVQLTNFSIDGAETAILLSAEQMKIERGRIDRSAEGVSGFVAGPNFSIRDVAMRVTETGLDFLSPEFFHASNVTIDGANIGMELVHEHMNATMRNVSIINGEVGIKAFGVWGTQSWENVHIANQSHLGAFIASSYLNITSSKVSHSGFAPNEDEHLVAPGGVVVQQSQAALAQLDDNPYKIRSTHFEQNIPLSLEFVGLQPALDARYNYWGNPEGPGIGTRDYYVIDEFCTKPGACVSSNVDTRPYLTSPP